MTDVIANLFVEIHPSKAKLTSFHDGNSFVVASTVSKYFLQQTLLRMLPDVSSGVLRNA
jgi:ribosomal protein L31